MWEAWFDLSGALPVVCIASVASLARCNQFMSSCCWWIRTSRGTSQTSQTMETLQLIFSFWCCARQKTHPTNYYVAKHSQKTPNDTRKVQKSDVLRLNGGVKEHFCCKCRKLSVYIKIFRASHPPPPPYLVNGAVKVNTSMQRGSDKNVWRVRMFNTFLLAGVAHSHMCECENTRTEETLNKAAAQQERHFHPAASITPTTHLTGGRQQDIRGGSYFCYCRI